VPVVVVVVVVVVPVVALNLSHSSPIDPKQKLIF
jgi:hypothetical protein